MHHVDYCDALEVEIERFAATYDNIDSTLMVPLCPEWSAHDLGQHLGSVHRWAEQLVRVRAKRRIPRSEMDLENGPVSAAWLRDGGAPLVATLRRGDPTEEMWAWGVDQHLVFWSRRQLHETFIHRLDLELATGAISEIDPVVALDAIDEFLVNLESDAAVPLNARGHVGHSETLMFQSLDVGRTWHIQLHDEGFRFVEDSERVDAALSGSAAELVTVLLRRHALGASELSVEGDHTLIEYWLANSAFE
jgi:uncharacterized protein (TIGR03083 family)